MKPVAVTVSQFQCNQVYQTLIPMIKVGIKKGFSIDHNYNNFFNSIIFGAKEETKLKGDISAYFNIEIMVIPSSFLQSFMCSVNIEDVNVFPQDFAKRN